MKVNLQISQRTQVGMKEQLNGTNVKTEETLKQLMDWNAVPQDSLNNLFMKFGNALKLRDNVDMLPDNKITSQQSND